MGAFSEDSIIILSPNIECTRLSKHEGSSGTCGNMCNIFLTEEGEALWDVIEAVAVSPGDAEAAAIV
jgi:hypothetical protein